MPLKRRAWWRRRRLWIALLAVAGGVALTLWLLGVLGSLPGPEA